MEKIAINQMFATPKTQKELADILDSFGPDKSIAWKGAMFMHNFMASEVNKLIDESNAK